MSRSQLDVTTLLFVSDTHLGYERRVETESGEVVPWIRDVSSTDAFDQVGQIAVRQGVDAVIHTGDILDHEVDEDTLSAAAATLDRLADHGIPVYCILGTHDHNAAVPFDSDSIDGIAWLKSQVAKGHLTELTMNPTRVAGGPVSAYGVSADNVGLGDVGAYESLEWSPSQIAFGASATNTNILCLHDAVTPRRETPGAVDLDALLAESRVSFECVLVGDEHRPEGADFEEGYTFETANGTPVFYTGPSIRLSTAYGDQTAFVTELTINDAETTSVRHTLS